MTEKLLYLLATFDEETSKRMKEVGRKIAEAGIIDKQTPDLPHHITLASFDNSLEDEIKQRLHDVCSNTKSFEISFSHIGLFGLNVLFFAPDVNYELLDLHKKLSSGCIKDNRGWTAHATILISDADNILRAIPLVAQSSFEQFNAKVKSICLYEFFPSRFITEYNLQC